MVHLVSVTRFPSFRTQPLENLSVGSVTNGFLSNPAPGENLESGNLVMETGCTPNFPTNSDNNSNNNGDNNSDNNCNSSSNSNTNNDSSNDSNRIIKLSL